MAVRRHGYKIEGLKELDEALKELPKATSSAVIKRAFVKAIGPMEATARSLAPKGPKQKLAQSISFGTKLSPRQRKLHRKESNVEFFAGAAALPHAHLQEFGTAHHGPQPFMRPAWDQHKMNVLGTFKDFLADEIEKTRARMARRAEREALKLRAGK
jgi:HK97 gp10 family phage protein